MAGVMKTAWILGVFSALCLVLVACGVMSAEQVKAAELVLADMLAAGQLTQVQYDALMQTLHQPGTWSWQEFVAYAATIGVSIWGSNVVRGPTATKAERMARKSAKLAAKASP